LMCCGRYVVEQIQLLIVIISVKQTFAVCVQLLMTLAGSAVDCLPYGIT